MQLIDQLERTQLLSKEELVVLLSPLASGDEAYLFRRSTEVRERHFGRTVYLRGLIEVSNHCRNLCRYCGINAANRCIERYRLSSEEIAATCRMGYELGFRTFVWQGGEDAAFDDATLVSLLQGIKQHCCGAAITLSLGERSRESYELLHAAGADRYLLRHETANRRLYAELHPRMNFDNRLTSLYTLRDIGFQVGSGFLIGLPGQTLEDLADDLLLLHRLQPQMIGIGPFIPHAQTDLRNELPGSIQLTARLIALLRLMFPQALIPATTALSTLSDDARIRALQFGANVVMPNLTPLRVRSFYMLYNGKKHLQQEAAESLAAIRCRLQENGLTASLERGDHPAFGF